MNPSKGFCVKLFRVVEVVEVTNGVPTGHWGGRCKKLFRSGMHVPERLSLSSGNEHYCCYYLLKRRSLRSGLGNFTSGL